MGQQRLKILVIGDTIVDRYVHGDSLGMSAEAPVVVVKETYTDDYVGGAAIVARHVRALTGQCSFISVVGNDVAGRYVKKVLMQEGLSSSLLIDQSRPTTLKKRYLANNQKLLRTSILQDHALHAKQEALILRQLQRQSKGLQALIVSDFGYGVVTPKILNCISMLQKKYNFLVFGDAQSSTQINDVSKFKNYFCITPTEKEARLALQDHDSALPLLGKKLLEKTGSHNVLLTLGEKGSYVIYYAPMGRLQTKHIPALSSVVCIDSVGAGDALIAGLVVGVCSGKSILEATHLGMHLATWEIAQMGNVPVNDAICASFQSLSLNMRYN